jgi:hypothetical protein
MRNELKYFFYVVTILSFIIFVGNYYFSNKNKKNFYRSTKLYDSEIIIFSDNLKTLKSDTENIIEYVENSLDQDKKKYKFWELLLNDEK